MKGLIVSFLFAISAPLSVHAAESYYNRAAQFELKEFTADFHHYQIGDQAPELYQTEPYIIYAWDIRHLPVPEKNSHWTYMGESYALIADGDGKILRAFKSDIFYPHG
ncbi:TPA: RcnB family protein [Raoultella planticola]